MSRKPPDFDLGLKRPSPSSHCAIVPREPPCSPQLVWLHLNKKKPGHIPQVPHISAPHIHVPSPLHKAPPQITGLDRRTTQKLTRGQVEIERRLDLHGTGIEMARINLLQFLREAQAMGSRTVLVITGKGDSPYSRHTLARIGSFPLARACWPAATAGTGLVS